MTSLEGFTKRSGRNPGQSPGLEVAEQLPGRQYLAMFAPQVSARQGTAFQAAVSAPFSEDFVLGYDRFA